MPIAHLLNIVYNSLKIVLLTVSGIGESHVR